MVWKFFNTNPDIYILDRVYNEITDIEDDLSNWFKNNYSNRLIDSKLSVNEYIKVTTYLMNSGKWTEAGYNEWTEVEGKADPWLIACALQNNYCIVTNERNKGPNGAITSLEPKIPFVANAFKVKTIDFWGFLGETQFKAQ